MEWIRRLILAGGVCTAAAFGAGAQTVSDDSTRAVSVRVAQAEVAVHPKDARAYVRLGHAYLKAGREEAMGAFRKAISLDKKLAEGYNGVGLVYLELKKDWQLAEKYFRQALQKDRSFVEAQYNIARAHMSVGSAGTRAARGEAERVVKMDSTYAPAYLILAEWHKVRQKHDRAIESYRKYMALRPEDQEVGYNVGLSLLMQGRYDEAETFAMAHLNARPRYGVLAQVMMHREDYVKALQAFNLFLDYLPPEERARYGDLSLVASPEELAEYRETPEAQRADFLRRFWLEHDPELVSGGTRRRAEHYRRVWYARTHFSEHTQPWDRRGEVYIRYGEPDYRSTSREMNFEVPIEVRQVQESMAFEIYGPSAVGVSFYGPVYPVRTDKTGEFDVSEADEEGEITSQRGEGAVAAGDTLGLARYRPVTSGFLSGSIPWESWVYTGIEGGLEVVFTDETLNGSYDFAPVPMPTAEDYSSLRAVSDPDEGDGGRLSSMLSRFQRFSPEAVMQRAIGHLPERYDVIRGTERIDFSYDLADFGAPWGRTRVEVYTGLPIWQFLGSGVTDTVVSVERTVALVDSGRNRIYRGKDDLHIRVAGGNVGMVLDQVDLILPPGSYEMGVQIREIGGGGRTQTYRQWVEVEAYLEGALGLSDVQVARQISPGASEGARFVKEALRVTPAPGRTFYSGQPVFLYFELYGLERDAFGATRYEVAHSVQSGEGRPLAVRVVSQLGQLLGVGEGEQEVAIRYEQSGSEPRVVDYVELDLGEAEPGDYRVRVGVHDLNANREVAKEVRFRLVEVVQ